MERWNGKLTQNAFLRNKLFPWVTIKSYPFFFFRINYHLHNRVNTNSNLQAKKYGGTDMKKTLVICGVVYTIAYVALCGIMVFKPEAYGKWIGKMFNGMTKVLED